MINFFRFLSQLRISAKINKIIHHYNVFGIMLILFDEILKDLKDGKDLNINNFGCLKLITIKSKKIFDINSQKLTYCKVHKTLKFYLTKKIRKKSARKNKGS